MRMKQVQTGLALYPFIAPSPPTPPPPAVAGPFVPVDLSAPLSAKHIFTRYLSYDLGRSLNPNNLPLTAGVIPSQHMKWVGSLGWWMGSDAILTGGRLYTDSHFTTELADMRSSPASVIGYRAFVTYDRRRRAAHRSEEHTSELQSHSDLVCRLLLEKKKKITHSTRQPTPRT